MPIKYVMREKFFIQNALHLLEIFHPSEIKLSTVIKMNIYAKFFLRI